MTKKTVFISYSHENRDILDELIEYLKSLKEECIIWADHEIEAGTDWQDEIKSAIEASVAAILLVSQSFLNSEFIEMNELPRLLRKEREGKGIHILPLYIESCTIDKFPQIRQFQGFNSPDKPLTELNKNDRKKLFVDVCERIEEILEKTEQSGRQSDFSKTNVYVEDRVIAGGLQAQPLPLDLKDQRVLVFDIDGTLLEREEKLSDVHHRKTLDMIKYFIGKNIHIVFITGNDYRLQKERVLLPIMNRGIASAVTCFSDGGSRLFEFNRDINDYRINDVYSNGNIFNFNQIEIIENEFNTSFNEFMEEDQNQKLRIPDIFEIDRHYFQNGEIHYIELMINPLKTTYYENKFDELSGEIEKIIKELKIFSDIQIVEKYRFSNSLALRIRGRFADKELENIRYALFDRFVNYTPFKNIALPEIEKRGTGNDICQLAIKPFKDEVARSQFMEKLINRLTENAVIDQFCIHEGGRTTIDIQLNGVDKKLAILELIKEHKLDPSKMIYFGDEFNIFGNDYPILTLGSYMPHRIINVGPSIEIDDQWNSIMFLNDGNGPRGTINYLEFLRHEV